VESCGDNAIIHISRHLTRSAYTLITRREYVDNVVEVACVSDALNRNSKGYTDPGTQMDRVNE